MFLDVQSRWPYIRISMQFTHCTRLEGERRWGGDWGGKFTRSDFNLVWPRAPSHKLGYQEECCCLFIRKISARYTGMEFKRQHLNGSAWRYISFVIIVGKYIKGKKYASLGDGLRKQSHNSLIWKKRRLSRLLGQTYYYNRPNSTDKRHAFS